MKAKLVVVGGEAKAAEINLKLPTIIGRGNEAPLTLRHPLVSRQHCEIFESNGQLIVRDLGSLNGTFINNERITEAVLPSGELLTVGTVTFRAVYDDAPSTKSTAKVPPRQQKTTRTEKTVGPPSNPTIGVTASKVSPSTSTKTHPSPKSSVAAQAVPGVSDTSEITGPPAKPEKAGKSGKGSQVVKPAAPAGKSPPALKPPPAVKEAAPPAKKKWADDSDQVDFKESEDEFELGEDESLHEPAAMPLVGEFTMQVPKPGTVSSSKPADDDGFDVDELDFDTPSTANLMGSAPAAGPSDSAVGDLTANFDPKKLAADEKARKLAKEKETSKAKEPAPAPAKVPAAKSPAAKAPAAKTPVVVVAPAKVQDSEKTTGVPLAAKEAAKKEEDEDLEAFFKSLGVD